MAATALAMSAPPGTSAAMWIATSGSAVGLLQSPIAHVAPGLEQPAVGEEPDQRRFRAELLHRRGRTETELPADRAGAVRQQPPAQLELALHPASDARVLVQRCHAQIMARA